MADPVCLHCSADGELIALATPREVRVGGYRCELKRSDPVIRVRLNASQREIGLRVVPDSDGCPVVESALEDAAWRRCAAYAPAEL